VATDAPRSPHGSPDPLSRMTSRFPLAALKCRTVRGKLRSPPSALLSDTLLAASVASRVAQWPRCAPTAPSLLPPRYGTIRVNTTRTRSQRAIRRLSRSQHDSMSMWEIEMATLSSPDPDPTSASYSRRTAGELALTRPASTGFLSVTRRAVRSRVTKSTWRTSVTGTGAALNSVGCS
jgi:hypothetical protein